MYLSRPEVQQHLGADVPFDTSGAVGMRFFASGDMLHMNHDYIAELLHRGVK